MAEVDFYKLERSVQDRFGDSSRGIGVPKPLARIPSRSFVHFAWLALAVAFAYAGMHSVTVGYGDLSSNLAISPVWMMGVYAALLAAAMFCALRGVALWRAMRTAPYERGLYLFPIGVVDARRDVFKVWRLEAIESVTASSGGLKVSIRGRSALSFPSNAAQAEQAEKAIAEAREIAGNAEHADTAREMAQLDPLIDSGFASPFSPTNPIVRQAPMWAKMAIPMAVVTGAALGFAIWAVRNKGSEKALFEAAKDSNDVGSYRAYVARGGKRSEVERVLLPRAELAIAAKKGTVEAIEEYIASHENTEIQAEVDEELRKAVTQELEKAKKARTVTALRNFGKRRKKYGFIKPALDEAVDTLFKKALADFKATTSGTPEVLSFAERLVGFVRDNGPTVEVKFVRRVPESVEKADAQVRRSAYFMGPQSIPSQYFTAKYRSAREAPLGAELVRRLQAPFPEDLLKVELTPPITDQPDPKGPFPEAKVPTVFIAASPNMSGGYMSPKPRGVFVGVGMKFAVRFAIPRDDDPLEHKSSTWRAPNALILKKEGKTVADVYEKMASDGYERFRKVLMKKWFAEEKKAEKE